MRAFHLEPADLAPGVGTVPSGVVELMRRQHEGFAYIRSWSGKLGNTPRSAPPQSSRKVARAPMHQGKLARCRRGPP